jgi:hypothetical protein
MTDSTAPTADLAHLAMAGVAPSSTPSPTPVPTLADVRAAARAELDGLAKNETWTKAYLAGDHNARADFVRLTELASRQEPGTLTTGPTLEAQRSEQADYCESIGLSPGVVQQVREGIPESQMTYKQALGLRRQWMSDPQWVSRYMAGGHKEREQMLLANIIISGPVALENR